MCRLVTVFKAIVCLYLIVLFISVMLVSLTLAVKDNFLSYLPSGDLF